MSSSNCVDLVSKFPTPRLQTDDGSQDVAQMHAREDLLLNHYTWVDEKAQTVRIPIARAMQILASAGTARSEQPAQPGQRRRQHRRQRWLVTRRQPCAAVDQLALLAPGRN